MIKRSLAAVTVLSTLATLTSSTTTGASTPSSLNGLTGVQIISLALAQMRTKGSFTVVGVNNEPGLTVTSVTSCTMNSGIRHDDYNGRLGERLFVNGVSYVRFSAGLVKFYFGKNVPSLANRWISFTPGQAQFSVYSLDVTAPTIASMLVLPGTLSVSTPLTFEAQSVVGITAANSLSTGPSGMVETLYVAEHAPYLPVALVLKSHLSGSSKPLTEFTFKNWGLPVTVSAPSHFTPSSQLTIP
jgi:hypothetical protein